MPTGTLSCPMCGAAVASLDSTQCDHCGARLATVACPSCFAMIFQGAKFCSHCGAKVERLEEDPASRRLCPHCKINLESVMVGTVRIRECQRCEGLWVDKDSVQEICTDREEQAAVLGLPMTITQNQIANRDLTVRYYPCPVCQILMNRVNFARCSGVIVDVCRQHGTWFDKDELHRIVEFIHAGGLDKARAAEIEELRRERQRLESVRATSSSVPMDWSSRPNWSPGRYDLFDIGVSAAASGLVSFFFD